jgi:hypothetical protein
MESAILGLAADPQVLMPTTGPFRLDLEILQVHPGAQRPLFR